jgi:2-keto-4-pentenoate hydratase/2-oxohepta-3-ene-1,7-dioic acid hydratase in catechol pathway
MRIANVDGRAVLLTSDYEGIDIAAASDNKFGPSPQAVYEDWEGFRSWAEVPPSSPVVRFERDQLGSPSPVPAQVIAIGLNYSEHAAESGFAVPETLPPTFTKFPTAISGPDSVVTLPPRGHTDWEVELVVIMGRTAHRVGVEEAWEYVAGLTVGQDLSERILQLAGPAPQFSLGKSFPGFAPLGPWLVTPDSVPNKDDLRLGCSIDGETVQEGRTKDLLFPVPALVAKLSEVITLNPGDVIFTGTPSGVGMGRSPQRFLKSGEELHSWIEGIGELHQRFIADGDD